VPQPGSRVVKGRRRRGRRCCRAGDGGWGPDAAQLRSGVGSARRWTRRSTRNSWMDSVPWKVFFSLRGGDVEPERGWAAPASPTRRAPAESDHLPPIAANRDPPGRRAVAGFPWRQPGGVVLSMAPLRFPLLSFIWDLCAASGHRAGAGAAAGPALGGRQGKLRWK